MHASGVVVLQSDPHIAQVISNTLSSQVRWVRRVASLQELKTSIAKSRAEVVILDIEATPFQVVRELSREFPLTRFVCTHRLADEEMWMDALAAGAADICSSSDTRAILNSALQNLTKMNAAAA